MASSFQQMNPFIQTEDLNVFLCVVTENITTDIQSFIQKLQALDPVVSRWILTSTGKSKDLLLYEDYSEPGFRGGNLSCMPWISTEWGGGFTILLAG